MLSALRLSQVVRLDSLSILLYVVVVKQLSVYQLEIKIVFLNGDLLHGSTTWLSSSEEDSQCRQTQLLETIS